MRTKLLIPIFLITTAFSCTVGKNYQRPNLNLPEQYPGTAASDTSIDMDWRSFLGDSTLVTMIDRALKGNFSLQLAMKRLEEANAYVKQTRVQNVPVLDAQVSASSSLPSDNSLNGKSLQSVTSDEHIEDYSLGLSASWEVDVWGKIRRMKEAAAARYLESYEGVRAVQTSLVAEMATRYFNVLMLDAQLRITRKNLAYSDTIVTMMQIQKASGQVTQLAVQQAEAQRQSIALLVPQLERRVAIEENTLRILSGNIDTPIPRSGGLEGIRILDAPDPGVPASMINRRPDVREKEMALMAANATVGIAQAQFYPSLRLTAAGGLNAFKASKWFVMPASLFGTVAGAVVQPVLQQRQLKTDLEVARVQRDEAVIQFREAALNATAEVVNALVSIEKMKSEKQIAVATVDTLHKATANANLLFKSGMADYLEVISVEQRSLDAELALADIRRQELAAIIELYRSLGGGWK